jgi:curved DNA-binding protein CbpA
MFIIDLSTPSHYSVLELDPDATAKEIRAKVSKLVGDLERQRQRARTPEEKRQFEERQKKLNQISGVLSHPANRAEYNRANAHLTFFTLRRTAAPALEDRAARLRLIHRAIRDFLAARGEIVEPLDDLERSGFSTDFTPNAKLDQLLQKGRAL